MNLINISIFCLASGLIWSKENRFTVKIFLAHTKVTLIIKMSGIRSG